jgi:hypothetical protein
MAFEGERVKERMREAARKGIDEIMASCVIYAKQNHPGWKNVTSTAEGSVRIVSFAQPRGEGFSGMWGSADVDYVIWLELNHGSFLRNAGDVFYRQLPGAIREHFEASA